MSKIVNQVIGVVSKIGRAGESTVVDFAGTVQIYDGNWHTKQNIKFVLTPAAAASDIVLLAAAIGKRLVLSGTFQQDDAPGTTVRAKAVTNIIVG